MQPFERDRQELCVIQKTRQVTLLKKSKCWLVSNSGPKSVLAKTGVFSPCLLRTSTRRKIRILYNFSVNHIKNVRKSERYTQTPMLRCELDRAYRE